MSRLRIRITKAAERKIRAGHPWVYSDSVLEVSREGAAGELAVIYDSADKFLAVGFYDPGSPLRVRIVSRERGREVDEGFWAERLEKSAALREVWFAPSMTNGYRVLHGESDGWPGLVLDRYDTTCVLKIYAAAWLPLLPMAAGLIAARLQPERLVLRMSRNLAGVAQGFATPQGEPLADGVVYSGPSLEGPVTFLENGIRFEADVLRGQKTGFFLDQRENRALVGEQARGKDLLNVFSYSGGFSLYAAASGARSVTNLDISPHALESAERNFKLNENRAEVRECARFAVQADAFDWLRRSAGKTYDIVVLDPPSMAKRQSEKAGALAAYSKLVESGAARVRDGGLLVAASCSAHVSKEEFFSAVIQAASRAKRSFEETCQTGHPIDHPAAFAEAAYLKCSYLRFR